MDLVCVDMLAAVARHDAHGQVFLARVGGADLQQQPALSDLLVDMMVIAVAEKLGQGGA